MQSKQKGSIAESETITSLLIQGYPVFKEVGDSCKVDLIAIVDNKPIKIQVKQGIQSYSSKGAVYFSLHKTGPNGHRYLYNTNDVDVFAVYIVELKAVCFIPWDIINTNLTVNIRYLESKNKQHKKVLWYEDYLKLVGPPGLEPGTNDLKEHCSTIEL